MVYLKEISKQKPNMYSPLYYLRRIALVFTILIAVVWFGTYQVIFSRTVSSHNQSMANVVYAVKK